MADYESVETRFWVTKAVR